MDFGEGGGRDSSGQKQTSVRWQVKASGGPLWPRQFISTEPQNYDLT